MSVKSFIELMLTTSLLMFVLGCNNQSQSWLNQTPEDHYYAAYEGKAEELQSIFQQATFEKDKPLTNGDTLLHLAVDSDNVQTVSMLLDEDVSQKKRDAVGLTAFQQLLLSKKKNRNTIIKAMVEKGAALNDVFKPSKQTNTNLAEGHSFVDSLSPLMLLCWGSKLKGFTGELFQERLATKDMVTFFIEKGSNINLKSKEGLTALMFAAMVGRTDIAKILIKNGADLKAKDKAGLTPIHYAALSGSKKTVQAMLDAGLAIDLTDKGGNTALHYAMKKKYKALGKMLLKKGADPFIKNKLGQTPDDWGKQNVVDEINRSRGL